MIDLEAIFGNGPVVVVSVMAPIQDDDGGRFVNWIQRPDRDGRMGWETPDLPEWQRWWARCDFDDLPVVPEGFSMGMLLETTPEDAPSCVAGRMGDTLDLGSDRPLQGQLRGFVGT